MLVFASCFYLYLKLYLFIVFICICTCYLLAFVLVAWPLSIFALLLDSDLSFCAAVFRLCTLYHWFFYIYLNTLLNCTAGSAISKINEQFSYSRTPLALNQCSALSKDQRPLCGFHFQIQSGLHNSQLHCCLHSFTLLQWVFALECFALPFFTLLHFALYFFVLLHFALPFFARLTLCIECGVYRCPVLTAISYFLLYSLTLYL